jgi:quinol-cytochrome oxidoreductase complex cytochrome b subunit
MDAVGGKTGEALGVLALGILIGGWAALRIRSGKSYTSNPPMRVTRKEDPFSFWLSVMLMLIVAGFLIVVAPGVVIAG